MMKKQWARKILLTLLIIILITVGTLIYFYLAFQDLTVSNYTIEADISNTIRIVQLSDLHNEEFGDNNAELVSLVEAQHPNLIIMSGDMLNRDDPDTAVVASLIHSLVSIAPVYFGYGNHETSWENKYGKVLHDVFTTAGAIVLDDKYVDVVINGEPVRIGGYMGYYRQPGMFTNDTNQWDREFLFFDGFESTDSFKMLINHIPTQWVDWNYIDKYPVDLVLCGHYHGGMVRIPFLDQGLYAPYIGWFPPFTKGAWEGSEASCILSTGLGTEHSIPRINNPPEIAVIDVLKKR